MLDRNDKTETQDKEFKRAGGMTMNCEIEIFAENLGFARRARGYTQAYMAERLGIARSTYAGYETGKRSPDVETFAKISKELFVSADELLGRYDYGTPNFIKEAKAEYFVEPRYSVDDYFDLPNCADYELIEGELIKKNAPGTKHQIISLQISMEFYRILKTKCKKCEVIPAPFCVVLSERNGVVVQPDISVICNRELLKDGICMGAPDLIVEIVSKNNKEYDYSDKLRIYHKYGVREYWIVDPEREQVLIYALGAGEAPNLAPFTEKVSSRVVKGLTLNLGKLLREHEKQFEG